MRSGNGRQYKQTVSLGEFRKRLYRRLGATACNLTSLDLKLDRPCMGARCEYDYRHTHGCARARDLPLSFFHSGTQKLRYTGGCRGIYSSSVTSRHCSSRLSRYRRFCTRLSARMNLRPGITAKFFRGKVDSRNVRSIA